MNETYGGISNLNVYGTYLVLGMMVFFPFILGTLFYFLFHHGKNNVVKEE